MDKHFKVSSSSKLKLGENVALRLMECLTPSAGFGIFMDNYFTSSCLLTRHSVSNMQATRVLNKNSLRKCTIIGDKQLQKKRTWPLWTAHTRQKSSVTLTVVCSNDSSVVYVASSESCEPKRFVRCWNKVKRKYIQEQQPINQTKQPISSTVTTRTWILSTIWTRMWPSIGIQMTKRWWFSFVWMVDVVLQCAWVLYHINKHEGNESLPLLAFRQHAVNVIFLKYLKEGRLRSSHLGIRKFNQIFAMMKQNITRCNLNTDVFRTPSNI